MSTVFIALFVILASFSIFMYRKKQKRIKALEDALSTDLTSMSLRIGFYDGTITFNDGVGHEKSKYGYRVYVTELERYSNGYDIRSSFSKPYSTIH